MQKLNYCTFRLKLTDDLKQSLFKMSKITDIMIHRKGFKISYMSAGIDELIAVRTSETVYSFALEAANTGSSKYAQEKVS